MGGRGSGGHNRLSDSEKVERGTYRADQSDTVYEDRAGAKVVTGPWLATIPEPEYPLNELGRTKYDEWTRELFEQNKLTTVTVTLASALALLHQKIHKRASEGKEVSAHDHAKFQSGLRDLNIAQHAKITASPGKNRWADAGFAGQKHSAFRLRPPRPPDTGEL